MTSIILGKHTVYGVAIKPQTQCEHYQTDFDIIAIRFKCCLNFYACYKCHVNLTNHSTQRWSADEFTEKAILCGACQQPLAIQTYLQASMCSHCRHLFNPSCRQHWHLYFQQ